MTSPSTVAARATLSVIIITKNESRHIGACLESVSFADEIIVVDSGSTDDTCEIAARFGARIQITPDWPGFGPQKNRALDLATSEWVLSIDADEQVTPELADEICRQLAATPANDTYEVARLSHFCGKAIRHSGWWPDYVLRFFKRDSARFTDAAVHEKLVAKDGRTGRLQAHFLHYPYDNLEALINKINRYSSDAAAMMYAKGKRTHVLGAVGHGFWTFVRSYLLRRGFLDGAHGFILAIAAGAGSFFRYAKLWLLQRQATASRNRPHRDI